VSSGQISKLIKPKAKKTFSRTMYWEHSHQISRQFGIPRVMGF